MKIGKVTNTSELKQQLATLSYPSKVTVKSNISSPLVVSGVLIAPYSTGELKIGDKDSFIRMISDMQQLSALKDVEEGFELILPPTSKPEIPPSSEKKAKPTATEVTNG